MNTQITQEIQDTIKKVLEVFTEQYTKHYFLALVKIIQEDAEAEPGPDYQLLDRPKDDSPPLKEGFMVKESSILKKWNKRYLVFRPDHNIDYFGSEEAAKAHKGKHTLNLVGYSIVDDPNQGVLIRLKRLAEKMGMSFEGLPKPKEYPPFTLEAYHPRRPCYYFRAENEEEFRAWVAQFRSAAWNAKSLTWDDEAHRRAFPKAIHKTRRALDRWSWWMGEGTEEQILGDLIAEELEYDITGRLLGALPGPWFVKSKLRSMAYKTIDTLIIAAVKPAWVALKKTIEEVKTRAEPTLRASLEPLFKAKGEIVEKMKGEIMKIIEPALSEHVNPHIAKIVRILKSPVVDAFAETLRLFEDHVSKLPEGEEIKKKFWDLDYFARSWWGLRTALDMIDPMYEPLWALHEAFKDILPWHLIWHGHDKIYKIADRVVYTFEKGIEDGAGPVDRAALMTDVISKYRNDAAIHSKNYYAHILKTILLPPFEAVVVPAGAPIIGPLANLVPEPLQQFVDINEMYEDLYNGVLDDSIQIVLSADEKKK